MINIKTLLPISVLILSASCGQEKIENKNQLQINDTLNLKIDSLGIDTSGIISSEDSVMKKMSSLMKSTESAHTKVKEIKVLKVENKVLKHDLIETKEQLVVAKEEIKKLDSAITSTKKKGLLQRIVDNFKDTIK